MDFGSVLMIPQAVRQVPGARLPPERLGIEVPAGPGHDADHRRAATDLTGDVDEPATPSHAA